MYICGCIYNPSFDVILLLWRVIVDLLVIIFCKEMHDTCIKNVIYLCTSAVRIWRPKYYVVMKQPICSRKWLYGGLHSSTAGTIQFQQFTLSSKTRVLETTTVIEKNYKCSSFVAKSVYCHIHKSRSVRPTSATLLQPTLRKSIMSTFMLILISSLRLYNQIFLSP
jgi:hypothetical protein